MTLADVFAAMFIGGLGVGLAIIVVAAIALILIALILLWAEKTGR